MYMRKVICVVVMALITLAMVSCGRKEAATTRVPTVEIATMKGLGDREATTFSGKTKSATEVNLAFRVSGTIVSMLAKEGDHVRKGQVVAIMDSRDYEVQLAATQAEYDQIKADAERVMALYAEGSTTASNNDKARYGLQQITQKLVNHRNQLEDTRLKSNIDGYVQTKLHEAGETVGAGMPVVSLFGNGDTEVEIKVSASDFARLNEFSNFYCRFDVTGDTTFPLVIARTSQEANSSQLYTVRLRFSGEFDRKRITPGMTTMVWAEMAQDQDSNLWDVEASAVLNEGGHTKVFRYDPTNSTVKGIEVAVKAVNRDGTMLVEGNLNRGDQIVVSGVHHIKDGQKVEPLKMPSESNVGGLL